MKKFFKILLWVLVPIIIIVLVLGYFGFVPIVSDIMGSNKPKDLGVKFTQSDYESGIKKTGAKFEYLSGNLKPEESLKYSGKVSLNIELSSSELTALIYNREWIYQPFSNWSVKINKDGTVETSGNVSVSNLIMALQTFGIDASEVQSKIPSYIKSNPPFFLKGKAKMENNNITFLQLDFAYIGKLNVTSTANEYKNLIESVIENVVSKVPNLNVKSLSFEEGKLKFLGTLPQKESFLPKGKNP